MSNQLQGKLIKKNDIQEFTSGFTKREFVVEVKDGKYPQEIKLELVKDNCSLIANTGIGAEIEVKFDIRGNAYKDKHYVNLVAWKVTTIEPAKMAAMDDKLDEASAGGGDDVDAIPFAQFERGMLLP